MLREGARGERWTMSDETDYYGELWSAIREQERIGQARKMLECLKAIPSESRMKPLEVLKAIDELWLLCGMEVARRQANGI